MIALRKKRKARPTLFVILSEARNRSSGLIPGKERDFLALPGMTK
jgi:hypothetical protein